MKKDFKNMVCLLKDTHCEEFLKIRNTDKGFNYPKFRSHGDFLYFQLVFCFDKFVSMIEETTGNHFVSIEKITHRMPEKKHMKKRLQFFMTFYDNKEKPVHYSFPIVGSFAMETYCLKRDSIRQHCVSIFSLFNDLAKQKINLRFLLKGNYIYSDYDLDIRELCIRFSDAKNEKSITEIIDDLWNLEKFQYPEKIEDFIIDIPYHSRYRKGVFQAVTVVLNIRNGYGNWFLIEPFLDRIISFSKSFAIKEYDYESEDDLELMKISKLEERSPYEFNDIMIEFMEPNRAFNIHEFKYIGGPYF